MRRGIAWQGSGGVRVSQTSGPADIAAVLGVDFQDLIRFDEEWNLHGSRAAGKVGVQKIPTALRGRSWILYRLAAFGLSND